MKSWAKSRTVWVAIGQAVVGVLLAVISADPALQQVGWVAAAKSVLDIVLRAMTTVAISPTPPPTLEVKG
jgi:ABC-type arginine transport system permease subunit